MATFSFSEVIKESKKLTTKSMGAAIGILLIAVILVVAISVMIIDSAIALSLILGVASAIKLLIPAFIRTAVANLLSPLAARIIGPLAATAIVKALALRSLHKKLFALRSSKKAEEDNSFGAEETNKPTTGQNILNTDISAIPAANDCDATKKQIPVTYKIPSLFNNKSTELEIESMIVRFPVRAAMGMAGAAVALTVITPPFAAAGFVGAIVGTALIAATGEVIGELAADMLLISYDRFKSSRQRNSEYTEVLKEIEKGKPVIEQTFESLNDNLRQQNLAKSMDKDLPRHTIAA